MYTEQEIGRRLSISTFVFYRYHPICEKSLEYLVRQGIRKIELLESPEQFDMTDSRSMKMIDGMCRSVGIHVSAYHCFKTSFDDIGSERTLIDRIDKCKRQIDTLLELGGNLWGSHAGDPDRYMRRGYEELARYTEGKEVVVAVENFDRRGVSIRDRLGFLRAMDHPRVGFILDVGHEKNAEGVNVMTIPGEPTRILQSCSAYLKHIHLHGYLDKDHYPPFVDGDRIRWGELFRGLEKTAYPGTFNFEPAGEIQNSLIRAVEAVGEAPERLVKLMAEG